MRHQDILLVRKYITNSFQHTLSLEPIPGVRAAVCSLGCIILDSSALYFYLYMYLMNHGSILGGLTWEGQRDVKGTLLREVLHVSLASSHILLLGRSRGPW